MKTASRRIAEGSYRIPAKGLLGCRIQGVLARKSLQNPAENTPCSFLQAFRTPGSKCQTQNALPASLQEVQAASHAPHACRPASAQELSRSLPEPTQHIEPAWYTTTGTGSYDWAANRAEASSEVYHGSLRKWPMGNKLSEPLGCNF